LIDQQIEFFFPQILLIHADTLLDFSFGKICENLRNLREQLCGAAAKINAQ